MRNENTLKWIETAEMSSLFVILYNNDRNICFQITQVHDWNISKFYKTHKYKDILMGFRLLQSHHIISNGLSASMTTRIKI